MRMKTWSNHVSIRVALALALLGTGVTAVHAFHPPPAAKVTAKKGSIQLTLRLYRTKVRAKKSLWYQIELKNVGKKRILIDDKIFSDPWAMHENLFRERGIYLDITAPPGTYNTQGWPRHKHDGPSPKLRMGGEGRVQWDWQTMDYSPQEKKELAGLEAKWTKEGLSEAQRVDKRVGWRQVWILRKESEQDTDPRRMKWLVPGASTATFAWAYRDEDPDAPHEDPHFRDVADEENQVGDYTQLWSYFIDVPGKYRIRVVYDHSFGPSPSVEPESWNIKFKTPQIEFEVEP